jgi:hypothetical protein
MFGGFANATHTSAPSFRDDWTWNGSSWVESRAPYGPSERWAAGYVWDPRGRRMLMGAGFGRDQVYGARQLEDTWSFDGTVWTRERLATPQGQLLSDGARLVVFSSGALSVLE